MNMRGVALKNFPGSLRTHSFSLASISKLIYLPAAPEILVFFHLVRERDVRTKFICILWGMIYDVTIIQMGSDI